MDTFPNKKWSSLEEIRDQIASEKIPQQNTHPKTSENKQSSLTISNFNKIVD